MQQSPPKYSKRHAHPSSAKQTNVWILPGVTEENLNPSNPSFGFSILLFNIISIIIISILLLFLDGFGKQEKKPT